MKKSLIIILIVGFMISFSNDSIGASKKLWWQKWNRYPNVPRIQAEQVKSLVRSGKKIVFIYAGYAVKEVVCGSLILPYNLVPPFADGSRIKLRIPKTAWIMCY